MIKGNHNSISEQMVIGVTMGDAAGIGPEVVVKALADPEIRRAAKFIVFGMNEQLCYAADRAEIEPFWGRHQHEKISREYPYKVVVADYDEYSVPPWLREPSRVAGEASIKFCTDAIAAAKAGIIDAIVTAPISKASWKMADAPWPGHTELFAQKCKSPRKAMMFVAGPLKVALATIHLGLFEVRNKFTIGCVFEPIDLLNDALKEFFGIENPRIGVAGLNPHAGEQRPVRRRRGADHRPGDPAGPGAGHQLRRPDPGGRPVRQGRPRRVRRGGRHVPRPGDDPGQAAGLRARGQHHDRPADRADRPRPRHGLRHRRTQFGESIEHEVRDHDGDPDGQDSGGLSTLSGVTSNGRQANGPRPARSQATSHDATGRKCPYVR